MGMVTLFDLDFVYIPKVFTFIFYSLLFVYEHWEIVEFYHMFKGTAGLNASISTTYP